MYCTSCNTQHAHDPHDGRIDWHHIRLEFFEDYAHNGEKDDSDIQLVPPDKK